MTKNYVVVHLPTTVGGNSSGLSKALKKLRVRSLSVTLNQNYINYYADHVVFGHDDNLFVKEIKRARLLIKVILSADVVHFNAGNTIASSISYPLLSSFWHSPKLFILKFMGAFYLNIFEIIELNLLKIFKKTIFVTFQGDDARQGDFTSRNFRFSISSQVDHAYYNSRSDKFKRKKIKRISKFASKIYALNPDLLHVLPKSSEFLPYSHIDLQEWQPLYPDPLGRPLRILHAPSNRAVKGTNLILAALDLLKSEGYRLELLLVEGMSNKEARKIYQTADILIDQLYAGWYGALAVELMALGKPVIAYIREGDLKFIPKKMADDLPIINAAPSEICDVLRSVLLMSPREINQLGLASRAYVEKWHDPLVIAKKVKSDYELALTNLSKGNLCAV